MLRRIPYLSDPPPYLKVALRVNEWTLYLYDKFKNLFRCDAIFSVDIDRLSLLLDDQFICTIGHASVLLGYDVMLCVKANGSFLLRREDPSWMMIWWDVCTYHMSWNWATQTWSFTMVQRRSRTSDYCTSSDNIVIDYSMSRYRILKYDIDIDELNFGSKYPFARSRLFLIQSNIAVVL